MAARETISQHDQDMADIKSAMCHPDADPNLLRDVLAPWAHWLAGGVHRTLSGRRRAKLNECLRVLREAPVHEPKRKKDPPSFAREPWMDNPALLPKKPPMRRVSP